MGWCNVFSRFPKGGLYVVGWTGCSSSFLGGVYSGCSRCGGQESFIPRPGGSWRRCFDRWLSRLSFVTRLPIDDPRGFSRGTQVGCYFGLVPCEDTSVVQRFGHITRDGPATAHDLVRVMLAMLKSGECWRSGKEEAA